MCVFVYVSVCVCLNEHGRSAPNLGCDIWSQRFFPSTHDAGPHPEVANWTDKTESEKCDRYMYAYKPQLVLGTWCEFGSRTLGLRQISSRLWTLDL